jgi:hypothetical protein
MHEVVVVVTWMVTWMVIVPQRYSSAVTGTGRGHHQEDREVQVGALLARGSDSRW